MQKILLLLNMMLLFMVISIFSMANEINAKDSMKKNKQSKDIIIQIEDKFIDIDWENNNATNEIKEELMKGKLTINLSRYGGFEQVGNLGKNYSTNDKKITAEAGDIMLYSGNNIVIFYGKNTWSYT